MATHGAVAGAASMSKKKRKKRVKSAHHVMARELNTPSRGGGGPARIYNGS